MLFLLLFSSVAWGAGPLSLSECYRSALKRSETFGIQEQLLVQATELETQARAALYPELSANATFLRQQQPVPTVAREQNTVKLTGTQPLFRGLREFAAIRQRGALSASQAALVADAARQLFYDVADAFYDVLALQADGVNFGNELEIARKRLKELEGFRRVGRSRASDVLSQRANIANLEAQLEATRAQLKIQRDVLAFLTGLESDTPLRDVEKAPSAAIRLEGYLGGVAARSDLVAASYALRAAEASVSVARGLHWPTADLVGNYYFERPASLVKWDVSLVLSLPLFQGGATQSQVRQAVAVQEQVTLQESRARRLAEQEVRRFFERVSSGRVQLEKLSEYADLARQNHEAIRRDYSNGLVTNLDVLQATTTWQIAQRSKERQAFAVLDDFVKLQSAAGQRAEVAAAVKEGE